MSRYTIDLGALASNYRKLAAAAQPGDCGAVVKANAYGLGAVEVVGRLLDEGCREFFVATIGEAEALRRAYAEPTLYVLGGADRDHVDRFIAADAIPVINHADELDAWRGRGQPRRQPVAIHVDTGMNRLGFDHAQMSAIDLRDIEVALLLSHFACADEPEHPMNALQRERFDVVRRAFPDVRASMANSGTVLGGAAAAHDLCRPGIALYGGNPFADRPNPMQAVVRFEAKVLQLREIQHDDSVGYGATYRARGKRLIATVDAGYADGVPRLLGNLGIAGVAGVRVPFVGRVSMDLTTLDVSEVAGRIALGDWVELIGETVGIDEVAALARTISYEILTGLGHRSERVYRG